MCVHMIDNSNNEIRGGGVKRDTDGDEKQLIKFAWPYYVHKGMLLAICASLYKLDVPDVTTKTPILKSGPATHLGLFLYQCLIH